MAEKVPPSLLNLRYRMCKRRFFTRRGPWTAFLLTQICPGWGQIYNRDWLWVGVSVAITLVAGEISTIYLFDSLNKMAIAVGWGLALDLFLSVQAFRRARRMKRVPRPPRQRKWWRLWLRIIFVYVLFAAVLMGLPEGYGYFMPSRAKSFQIPSESMVPNLLVGDYLVADGWSYWHADPKRGDIIVFLFPHDHSLNYVKRLIGLPGDTVQLKNGVLFVNGKEMPQKRDGKAPFKDHGATFTEYVENLDGVEHTIQRASPSGLPQDYGPVTVPAGQYFMMGDNRDRSSDSRVWGFVRRDEIEAQMKFIWFSYDKSDFADPLAYLDLRAWRGAVRKDRMGMQVR